MDQVNARVPDAVGHSSCRSAEPCRTKRRCSLRPRLCSAPAAQELRHSASKTPVNALMALRPGTLSQQLHRIDGFLLQLIQRALSRCLVQAPAQDGGAVTKTFAAEMIVTHLDDQLRPQRAPLRGTLGGPAAWAARRVAGESWWADQRFEFCR